jgi:hypothetical protein
LLFEIRLEVLSAISGDERADLKQVYDHSLVVPLVLLVGGSLVLVKVGYLVLVNIFLNFLEDMHDLVVALSQFVEGPAVDDEVQVTSLLGVQQNGVNNVVAHRCG